MGVESQLVGRSKSQDSIPAAQQDAVLGAELELVELFKENAGDAARRGAPEGGNGDDLDDALLATAIKESKIDSRGALGARFDRFLANNPEQRKDIFSNQRRGVGEYGVGECVLHLGGGHIFVTCCQGVQGHQGERKQGFVQARLGQGTVRDHPEDQDGVA